MLARNGLTHIFSDFCRVFQERKAGKGDNPFLLVIAEGELFEIRAEFVM